MATHRYNIENAMAQLIVASFNECEIKQHHSRHGSVLYKGQPFTHKIRTTVFNKKFKT